ncbi:MAG: hypothetical protein M3A44_13290 [Gammaproteobacteria bacterium]
MKKVFYVIPLNILSITLFGCMSQIRPFTEYVNGVVGQPINSYIEAGARPGSYASRIGWKDRRYKLENGNWVYVAPEREGCIIHWEVNPQGIIVGYRTEGNRCDW